MSKPPKLVIPGLNRGIGVPPGFVLGRLPGTGQGPAQLLDLIALRKVGVANVAGVTQSTSTAISTAHSETVSLKTSVSTSLSQISSSLSGAVSSTGSLSSAVSTVISGSISAVNSRVDSLSTAVGGGGGGVDDDSGLSTSLSQISSSLSTEISVDLSRINSLSTAIGGGGGVDDDSALSSSLSSAVSINTAQSTSLSQISSSLSGALSSITSLSTAISTVDSNQSTSLSQISSSLSAEISTDLSRINSLSTALGGGGGGTWTSAYSASLVNDSNGWTGFNFRVRFNAAALSDIVGTQVRITLGAGSSEGITISEAWIGIESGGSFQFASAVQLKWATATSKVIAANTTEVSDGATLAIDGSSDVLVLAMYLNGGSSSDMFRTSNVGGNVTGEFKSGSNEASLTGVLSGYTGTTSSPASLIEFLV